MSNKIMSDWHKERESLANRRDDLMNTESRLRADYDRAVLSLNADLRDKARAKKVATLEKDLKKLGGRIRASEKALKDHIATLGETEKKAKAAE